MRWRKRCWRISSRTGSERIREDKENARKSPIRPDVSLYYGNIHFTRRQLQALRLIDEGFSLRGAAAQLGVSAPTVFNYIGRLEEKCAFPLLIRNKGRASLTSRAREIVEYYRRWESSVTPVTDTVIACTPLSEGFVRDAVDLVNSAPLDRDNGDCEDEESGSISMVVGNDELNLELGLRSIASVVIFDDPLIAYELPYELAGTPRTFDVGIDSLMLYDTGDDFIRFRYGAQRLGFRWLESRGREYTICGTGHSPGTVMGSGLSFFMERSLVRLYGFKENEFIEDTGLQHAVVGLRFKEGDREEILCRNIVHSAQKLGFRQ